MTDFYYSHKTSKLYSRFHD